MICILLGFYFGHAPIAGGNLATLYAVLKLVVAACGMRELWAEVQAEAARVGPRFSMHAQAAATPRAYHAKMAEITSQLAGIYGLGRMSFSTAGRRTGTSQRGH